MALNFGKLNFSTSFNPTSAFPLDARCYFEDLASAQAAAASAEAAGSSNTVYYFGETLAVLENNVATLYIIQPKDETGVGGELVEVGSKTLGDEKSIKLVDGTLSLVGFETAAENQVPYRKADGSLGWQVVSALVPESTATVGDDATVNVSLIDNKYVVTLRGKDSAADKAILRKHISAEGVVSYTWDVIYDKAELDALLANKVDKENGKSLVSDTEITKLAGIEAGAQANVIEEIKVNGVKVEPTEKAVNIDVAGEVGKLDIEASKVKVAADKTLATKLTEVDNAIAAKQDALTAGKGIIIQENTIKLDESIILGGGGAADWKE